MAKKIFQSSAIPNILNATLSLNHPISTADCVFKNTKNETIKLLSPLSIDFYKIKLSFYRVSLSVA
jgi:hypothetical protein